MASVRENTAALVGGMAFGFAAIAALVIGFIEPPDPAWLVAGGVLTVALLAAGSSDLQDPLYPARLQLARFRRTGQPADILVVKLSSGPLIRRRSASRRNARAARGVLRASDAFALVPSLRGCWLCAVLEPDARARSAIELRLRDACGSEIGLGWASFPEHGVTLESLITAAADRVPEQPAPRRPVSQGIPARQLASRSLETSRAPIKGAR
jgi:hypothetical protein